MKTPFSRTLSRLPGLRPQSSRKAAAVQPVKLLKYFSRIGVPLVADFWAEIAYQSIAQAATGRKIRPWRIDATAVTGNLDTAINKDLPDVSDPVLAAGLTPQQVQSLLGVGDVSVPYPPVPPAARPGDVLGSEPVTVLGSQRLLTETRCERLFYVTRDGRGNLISAACVVVHRPRPASAALAPIVAIAPSTQGVAPHCDPSRSCQVGVRLNRAPLDAVIAYELPVILGMVEQGADVVFIDYPRDKDTGIQLYGNHTAAGQSLVDAIRAAQQWGLSAAAPIGLWGFSQGGGAVAWVCDHPQETEKLKITASVVAAPPVDLLEVGRHIEGGAVSGVLAYCMAALIATHAEVRAQLLPRISSTGFHSLRRCVATCASGTVASSGWRPTDVWSKDGRTLADLALDVSAVRHALADQVLGTGTPPWPCYVFASSADDVIPVGQVRRLARAWRDRGAAITYVEHGLAELPLHTGSNHFVPYFLHLPTMVDWLIQHTTLKARS